MHSVSDTNPSSDDVLKSELMPQRRFYVRLFLSVGLSLAPLARFLALSLSDWGFDSLESLKSWVLIRALRPGSEHGVAWHDGSV